MLADVNLSPLVTVDKSLTGNAKYSSFFFFNYKKRWFANQNYLCLDSL